MGQYKDGMEVVATWDGPVLNQKTGESYWDVETACDGIACVAKEIPEYLQCCNYRSLSIDAKDVVTQIIDSWNDNYGHAGDVCPTDFITPEDRLDLAMELQPILTRFADSVPWKIYEPVDKLIRVDTIIKDIRYENAQ